MVTIFSTLKPLVGHIGIIQRNAVKSWTKLRGNPEVILLGDEFGVSDLCKELNIKHIPDVECSKYGRPYCKSVFCKAQEVAKHDINTYVNGDIILTNSFIYGAERAANFDHFLMIGRRYDLDVNSLIDFDNGNWESSLKSKAIKYGSLHKNSGIDYFAFRKLDWLEIPPMVIGKIGWDNWMVSKAVSREHVVIDATRTVLVIHQNHIDTRIKDYKQLLLNDPESAENRKLADTLGGNVHKGFTDHATWIMKETGEAVVNVNRN